MPACGSLSTSTLYPVDAKARSHRIPVNIVAGARKYVPILQSGHQAEEGPWDLGREKRTIFELGIEWSVGGLVGWWVGWVSMKVRCLGVWGNWQRRN